MSPRQIWWGRALAWTCAIYGMVVGYVDKAGGAQCTAIACFIYLTTLAEDRK